MSEVITYSLKNQQADAEAYYRTIRLFADEVVRKANLLQPIVEDFRRAGIERPALECTFELLLLGTLWRVYGHRALSLRTIPRFILTRLAHWRESQPILKPRIDRVRGLLGTLFLSPFAGRGGFDPTPAHLARLIHWLSATGEFNQEVKRLKDWHAHWCKQTEEKAADEMEAVLAFTSWFEDRSERVLGAFTPRVEPFLKERHPRYRWREDAVACGRARVEYHANMVGAELLNRAYREEFDRTRQREVLLPSCMRQNPANCQAKHSRLGLRCVGCDPQCPIHRVTQLGQDHGFGVIVMLHASALFEQWEEGEAAIVGVACVPTLIGGGLKARSQKLPAQCVLLDHCGCQHHWHETGVPTEIDLSELKRVLGIEDARNEKSEKSEKSESA